MWAAAHGTGLSAGAAPPTSCTGSGRAYRVAAGDSLSKIAARFGVTVHSLLAANLHTSRRLWAAGLSALVIHTQNRVLIGGGVIVTLLAFIYYLIMRSRLGTD